MPLTERAHLDPHRVVAARAGRLRLADDQQAVAGEQEEEEKEGG